MESVFERIFCVWLTKKAKKEEIESGLEMLLMCVEHEKTQIWIWIKQHVGTMSMLLSGLCGR